MRFQVRHETRFRYSRPVYLEPLTIRLRPRSDFRQRVIEFGLAMDPVPEQAFESMDLEGNQVATAHFSDLIDSLVVTTQFVAETEHVNPFGYLLSTAAAKVPLMATADEQLSFNRYLAHGETPREVAELANRIAS